MAITGLGIEPIGLIKSDTTQTIDILLNLMGFQIKTHLAYQDIQKAIQLVCIYLYTFCKLINTNLQIFIENKSYLCPFIILFFFCEQLQILLIK